MTTGQIVHFRTVQGATDSGTYLGTHVQTGELHIQTPNGRVWILPRNVTN